MDIDVRDLDLYSVSQTVFPNWKGPTPIVDHRTAQLFLELLLITFWCFGISVLCFGISVL